MMLVRLEPTASGSQVKHSTTELPIILFVREVLEQPANETNEQNVEAKGE